MYTLNKYPHLRSWDRRVPKIIEELTEHLDRLTRCALEGQLYISESVLYEELDLVRLPRSVKRWLRGTPLASLHKNHLRSIQQLLHRYLTPRPVSNEVKNSFRQRFSPSIRPKDRDATLLVVACELAASGRRTLILAHNHDYEEPVKKLRKDGEILLADGRLLPIADLERWPYENVLLTLHESCCIERERFRALGYGFIIPEENRAILDKRLPLVKKKNIFHEVRLFRDQLHRSIENKIRNPCIPAWHLS